MLSIVVRSAVVQGNNKSLLACSRLSLCGCLKLSLLNPVTSQSGKAFHPFDVVFHPVTSTLMSLYRFRRLSFRAWIRLLKMNTVSEHGEGGECRRVDKISFSGCPDDMLSRAIEATVKIWNER